MSDGTPPINGNWTRDEIVTLGRRVERILTVQETETKRNEEFRSEMLEEFRELRRETMGKVAALDERFDALDCGGHRERLSIVEKALGARPKKWWENLSKRDWGKIVTAAVGLIGAITTAILVYMGAGG